MRNIFKNTNTYPLLDAEVSYKDVLWTKYVVGITEIISGHQGLPDNGVCFDMLDPPYIVFMEKYTKDMRGSVYNVLMWI